MNTVTQTSENKFTINYNNEEYFAEISGEYTFYTTDCPDEWNDELEVGYIRDVQLKGNVMHSEVVEGDGDLLIALDTLLTDYRVAKYKGKI